MKGKADEGTELRAEWCPKGDGIAMYIGFESPEGNMAYRELGEYPTEREIAEAVAEVLAKVQASVLSIGKSNSRRET